MYKQLTLLTTTIFLFSGCSLYISTSPSSLPSNIQKLNGIQKQIIYKTIQDEISMLCAKGDLAYENGHVYDAITDYEKVNLYKGYSFIPAKKIKDLKNIAAENSILHYKQAMKYLRKDKYRALKEFNLVIVNNPNYKDTKEQHQELKKNEKIKEYISSLESKLKVAMDQKKSTPKYLNNIESASSILAKYEYNNPLIQEAKDILKSEYSSLIEEAIATFNKAAYDRAHDMFKNILSTYANDKTANEYIVKIANIKEVKTQIANAEDALNKEEYVSAFEFANKALLLDETNQKAKNIIDQAHDGLEKRIAILMARGKSNYYKKYLKKAKQNFQEILSIRPGDNTALVYIKKIDRQLKTLSSLQ